MKKTISFRKNCLSVCAAAFFILLQSELSAQDRKAELEQTKQKLEKEISLSNQLLEETKKTKNLSLNELSILQSRIRQRENLIATLRKQLEITENKLQRTSREVEKTEGTLAGLKKEYAQMISFAYKNRNGLNQLMFVFAADDFNQAYRRLKYLQQYSALRQNQIARMNETQDKLSKQKLQLEAEKSEKIGLLDAERKQQLILAAEKAQIDQTVKKNREPFF